MKAFQGSGDSPDDFSGAVTVAAGLSISASHPALETPSDLKNWQRTVMSARLAVLAEVDHIRKASNMSLHKAIKELLSLNGAAMPGHLKNAIETANHRGGKTRMLSALRIRVLNNCHSSGR